MTTILPVASGKGGVGKTVCTANLGVALARAGKTVILVDLDLGGSNLHTCLGQRNNRAGIGNLILKQEQGLESLLTETAERRLYFIPGDSLLPGSANLSWFRKQKILSELPLLVADYVLLDLGAGTSYNTLDFFLISNNGLVVIAPETTSILNAYSFIKSALFRLLYRSFDSKSPERQLITEFGSARLEGSDAKLGTLIQRLGEHNPQSGELARRRQAEFVPRVILNMGRSNADLQIGARLRQIVQRNLEIDVHYVGFVPHEARVARSIIDRTPAFASDPASPFSQAVATVADRLQNAPVPPPAELFADNRDLDSLSRDALQQPQADH